MNLFNVLSYILLCNLISSQIMAIGCPINGWKLFNCLMFVSRNNQLPKEEFSPLSYCDLEKLYNDKNGITKKQRNDIIKESYYAGNPVLFINSKKIIKDSDYSLNFLWINDKKLENEKHLLGQNEILLKQHVLDPIMDWRYKQPNAYINFWYDGNMVSEEALENTKQILNTKVSLERIKFRNIRDIPLVQQNSRLYGENNPVYFRVDLSKAIIADYLMNTENITYSVNIDADIVAITKEHLFDKKTIDELEDLGYAFGSAGTRGIFTSQENSFIMLYNDKNLETSKSHTNLVVSLSIEKAHQYLDQNVGEKLPSELVYYKYESFRDEMRYKYYMRNKILYKPKYNMLGKAMIFPKSIFGSSGYSIEQIKILKKALVTADGCASN